MEGRDRQQGGGEGTQDRDELTEAPQSSLGVPLPVGVQRPDVRRTICFGGGEHSAQR